MEVFTVKKVGDIEITLSIVVDESSQNADKAFGYMHKLIDSFYGLSNADTEEIFAIDGKREKYNANS